MDSPAHPVEDLGVTRLVSTCGHLFCRKELSTSVYGHIHLFLYPSCMTDVA